ncbi:MAG: SH3 domain-containing protein [Myxococcales bacterium]|nr:SH3 domain-containing protein [Myxococcales bacterium]
MPRVDLARLSRGAAVVLVAAAALLGGSVAHAERVRTTDRVKVYRNTGEQSGVVTKVAEGTTLKVLKTEGRWLKVRVNGRTGWITRSNVTSLDDDDVPRNTRRRPFVDGRSTRRGWGDGAPEDRVGADATDPDDGDAGDDQGDRGGGTARGRDDDKGGGDDEDCDDCDERDRGDDDVDAVAMVVVTAPRTKLYPRASRKAKSSRTLRRGARLIVLERDADWVRVEFDDDAGFVRADDVADADARPPRVARQIFTKARLGFASLGGTFTSDGPAANPLARYQLGSTAISVNLGVEVAYAYKRDYFLGGGVEYLGCVATPGIRYGSEDIGFKTHDVDLRVIGGYDLRDRRGTVVWGRVGYHVGILSMSNLMNAANIPSETFRGPAIGASVTMPRLTPTIGVAAALDLVYPGTRSQTQGNEDGALDGAMGLMAGLTGAYAWKPAWNLEAAYRFGYAKTAWTGPSNRGTGSNAAERVDKNHVVTVGLARTF